MAATDQATPAEQRPWLIYGAYGFTGRMIVEEAIRRGHRPVLAGRDAKRLRELADRTGLPHMVIRLDDARQLHAQISAHSLVLNAAGPFTETGRPLIEASLATRVPYLDVSGEISHLRFVSDLDQRARNAGVALLTGAGFGATFGDCLARHVAERLPDATHLRLSIDAANAQSTAAVRRTTLGVLAEGGYAVEGGKWRSRPLGHAAWTVSDGSEVASFASAPLGELAAVQGWAKAANIVVGRPMAASAARQLRLLSPLIKSALRIGPLREWLGRSKGNDAPVAAPEPAGGWRSRIWAEAWNARGERVTARLETGEGYAATARATIVNAEALAAANLRGAFTPASAFGADHVLKVPGVSRVDVDATH